MELTPLYSRVIGLDVHHEQVTACAIIGQKEEPNVLFQTFATFHSDCQALAAWAKKLEPEVVIMESTGIYWKSVNRALMRAGLKTVVANAWHLKQVPGRKTDIADSQWLAVLGRAGLVNGSFLVGADLEHLRLISRQRQKYAGVMAGEKNRLHKVLADAGLRLSLVVSDLNGLASRRMIECLIEGGSPDDALELMGRRLRSPKEAIAKALEGELTSSHLVTLRAILSHIQWLESTIAHLEAELIKGLGDYEWALRLLETIPGIDRVGAAMLLVEIGADMAAFGSASRLASWAGVCPGNNESAGKKRSGKTRKANHWVRRLLCEMAQAARSSKSMFKAKYQSLAARRGAKRAVIAVSHKMLRIIYAMLSRKQPYHDREVNYEEELVRKNAPRWIQKLKKYGFWPDPTFT